MTSTTDLAAELTVDTRGYYVVICHPGTDEASYPTTDAVELRTARRIRRDTSDRFSIRPATAAEVLYVQARDAAETASDWVAWHGQDA